MTVAMRDDAMNIGEASRVSGVSPKMIRHYESLGLIPKAARSGSGYRRYSGNDVHLLRFIARARDLGFSTAEISQLVSLWQDRARPSAKVKALALEHVERLEQKARELLAMKATLEKLAASCHGDDRPECPILDTLAADTGEPVERYSVMRSPSDTATPGAGNRSSTTR